MPRQANRTDSVEAWPTLAELEPVANYLAARFAQKGVSVRKVQGISEVLQYHCLRRQADGLHIEFGLLGGWLTRSRNDYKDDIAFDILCMVLGRFADRHDALSDAGERRDLYRLLTDWLSVLTWKFRALADKNQNLLEQVSEYADQVEQTTQAVRALSDLTGEDSLAAMCRQIAGQLESDMASLPYRARMAVGVRKE
jgi:hypothetical protein